MNREASKKILKIAVVIYVASFLILNWNDISWVFNYRAVSGLFNNFFTPYPSIDASSMNAYFYPNHNQVETSDGTIKNAKIIYTDKQNTLEIPKISISAPIIFSENRDQSLVTKDLNSGVVFYPGSVYPGQKGQTIILGHSAPAGWPKIKYDWVFSGLNELNLGDIVYIDLNNKQYTYIVKKKTIIKRGADVPADNSDSNTLILISCWPPGKDYQRIAVQAELQKND